MPASRAVGLVAALLSLVPAAGALAQGKPAAGPAASSTARAATPDPVDPANDPLCRSMGKGFQRLPGTQTCVKISGNVQAEGYAQSYDAAPGSLIAPALRSR